MRRRFRRTRSSGSKIRSREWLGIESVDAATGNPAVSITLPTDNTVYANYILSPDEMQTVYDEPTLVRGILHWDLIPNGAWTAGAEAWFGIGLIKSDIEAPGGTLPSAVLPFVPLPFFDSDSAWIWQRAIHVGTSAGSTFTGADAQLQDTGAETFKTKRKFQLGEGLLLVAYFRQQGGTTGGIRFHFGGRILWLNR